MRNGTRFSRPDSCVTGGADGADAASGTSASVTPNGATVHQGTPSAAAAARIRAIG